MVDNKNFIYQQEWELFMNREDNIKKLLQYLDIDTDKFKNYSYLDYDSLCTHKYYTKSVINYFLKYPDTINSVLVDKDAKFWIFFKFINDKKISKKSLEKTLSCFQNFKYGYNMLVIGTPYGNIYNNYENHKQQRYMVISEELFSSSIYEEDPYDKDYIPKSKKKARYITSDDKLKPIISNANFHYHPIDKSDSSMSKKDSKIKPPYKYFHENHHFYQKNDISSCECLYCMTDDDFGGYTLSKISDVDNSHRFTSGNSDEDDISSHKCEYCIDDDNSYKSTLSKNSDDSDNSYECLDDVDFSEEYSDYSSDSEETSESLTPKSESSDYSSDSEESYESLTSESESSKESSDSSNSDSSDSDSSDTNYFFTHKSFYEFSDHKSSRKCLIL